MNGPGRPQGMQRMQIPDTGGKISISLVETRVSAKAGGGCRRTPKDRILAKLEQSAKLLDAYPSDDVETFHFEVKWEPTKGALGTNIPSEFLQLDSKEFQVVSPCSLYIISRILSFVRMLAISTSRHSCGRPSKSMCRQS